jgi:hypothetical protein
MSHLPKVNPECMHDQSDYGTAELAHRPVTSTAGRLILIDDGPQTGVVGNYSCEVAVTSIRGNAHPVD